jgi:hypothetical protein
MPPWLVRAIVGTSIAIMVLITAQWAACRFYVWPMAWPWYTKYVGTPDGRPIEPQPTCNDSDSRAIASMMGVLTTLISLSRKAD